jgi:DNA invertase Pin-like site-specific DNA recombinase
MTNQLTKVALYSRVSTNCGKQDVENQLAQLRDFCQRQGWTIVQEFVDHASGKRSDRPAFTAMFETASRREFDCLLFWSLDRLSREGVYETLQHLQQLTAYGVNYKSFTEQYLDSCGIFRDAVIGILATVAKQERIRISERVQAGLARARKQGRVGGRPKVVASVTQMRKLANQGFSAVEIGERLGVSRMTVARRLADT